jgi:hypothetical protein
MDATTGADKIMQSDTASFVANNFNHAHPSSRMRRYRGAREHVQRKDVQ